jgi:FKBP-type peptidyl-prolyl cis-trans isomerase FkpA/FKBP-type peptidyl-prolyl cis-trans isomerase FklB
MKHFALTIALAASTLPSALVAQQAPPAEKPAPPPAAPPPAAAEPPGLLPPPSTAPAGLPDGFSSEKERQSYALGSFFASQEKNNAAMANLPPPNPDDLLAGLKDVLAGGKSTDYVAGATIGVKLRRLELEVDQEVLFHAMQEALAGRQLKMTQQQQQAVLQRIQTEITGRVNEKKKAEAEKALAAAREFLASNAKTEGVKQTPSGLQYKIEKPGEGKSATDGDMATLNYKAAMSDGTEFEKSPATGPARKPVKMLPQGVREALTILKTGGKGTFWIPPALGFAETVRPPRVKANMVLVYEIELLSVEPLPKPATTGTQPVRPPVTAVTPPITVEIPPKPDAKNAPKTPPAPNAPKPPAPPPVPPVPPPDKK